MNSKLQYLLFGAVLLALVASCNNQDEPVTDKDVPENGDGQSISIDEASFFEQNFIITDNNGNQRPNNFCAFADENDPTALYVGASSPDEAKELFMGWIAPGCESKVVENANGIIEYHPTSAEGESQGIITYTPETSREKFGTVNFSSQTPIFSFRKILIIPESLFPHNLTQDENVNLTVYDDKIGGKVIEHRTIDARPDTEYTGFIITDREWATSNQKYVIFVFRESISGKEDLCREAPTLGELCRIGKWIKEAKEKHGVDIYQKFKEEGISFDEKTVFWAYQTSKRFPWIWTGRWACDLRGKQEDWWNIEIKDPYKRFLYIRKI